MTKTYLVRHVVLCFAFFLCLFAGGARYVVGSEFLPSFVALLVISAILCALVYGRARWVSRDDFALIFTVSMCFIYSLFGGAEEGYRATFFSVVMLLSLVVSHSAVRENLDLFVVAKIALYGYWAFLFYSGVSVGLSPADVNGYLADSSRNVVSGLAILFQVFYSATYYERKNKLPLMSGFVTVVVCVIAYGRSGVLLSMLLFFFCLFYNCYRRGFAGILVLGAFGTLLFGYLGASLYEFLLQETNLAEGIESPRMLMLKEYFEGFTLYHVLFGRSFSGMPTILHHSGNPHNSYVMGHHYYGVFYVFLMLHILYVVMKSGFRRRSSVYAVLAGVILVRSYFDVLSLPGFVDVIVFYLVLKASRLSSSCHVRSEKESVSEARV